MPCEDFSDDVTSVVYVHETNADIQYDDATVLSDNDTSMVGGHEGYVQNFSFIAIDFGTDNEKTVVRMRLWLYNLGARDAFINSGSGKFQGSNDSTDGEDGTWDDLVSFSTGNLGSPTYPEWSNYVDFENTTAYRWYRVYGSLDNNNSVAMEWEMFECMTVDFSFSAPFPQVGSTIYDVNSQPISIVVTVSGTDPSYVYNASFYDGNDAQIGSTISGTQSGYSVDLLMPTSTAGWYSWYVVATSSGSEGTSATYTFRKRYICAGTVTVDSTLASGIPVRLYKRSDGTLVSGTLTTSSGTFQIITDYDEDHYVVALYNIDTTNALIYDWVSPV